AYAYFRETAFVDLEDLAGNTSDGLHLAALAGTLLVAVAGFGGMRDYGETLAFAPRLTPPLTRLAFRLLFRGRRLRVAIMPDHARYDLVSGDPLEIIHHGEKITLTTDTVVSRPFPPMTPPPPVSPPWGRNPGR